MNFEWPWVFTAFPLPVLLHRFLQRQYSLKTIPVSTRLGNALGTTQNHTYPVLSLHQLLSWIIWLLLLIALAQPGVVDKTTVQPASGRALSVVVDLSGSMEREDFEWQGEQASRLDIVKRVASEFIQARAGDRVSLVLFASKAYIATPLTFDVQAVQNQLAAAGIGMAGRSTGIGDALGLAIQSLTNDPASDKAIVLLSDGTNNAGAVSPEDAAEFALSRGIRVHTIAMGSDKPPEDAFSTAPSADLDEETLKQIAASANGQFFRARTTTELQQIYQLINALERAEVEAPPIVIRRDLRHWPLMLLLGCLIIRAGLHHRRALVT